jgi:hypothetical protein
MAKYSVSSASAGTQQALTTTYKTLISQTAATGATTLRRAWIYDVEFGADGTPADNVLVFKVDRQTTVGTATAATAAPLDPADAAALIVSNVNHTAEPTVTANTQLIEVPLNQRSSYRWVTIPGSGAELVVPATNVAGLGCRAKSPAYTSTGIARVHFFE